MIISSCNEINFVPNTYDDEPFYKGEISMRKVVLRMKELFTYDVMKKIVDSNGDKESDDLKLNYTLRTINRLVHKDKCEQ